MQNNLARIVCRHKGRFDAKPLLCLLHRPIGFIGLWSLLWDMQRLCYRMALLSHKVLTTSTPAYLNDLLQTQTPTGTLKMRDMKMRHHTASRENARHEKSAPKYVTWKCETWKCGT